MNAGHVDCGVTEAMVDRDHKIISTPAYMYDASISEVYAGIRIAVSELLRMIG
jgi:enhancing lycopene biosynthesis protein 2